MRHVTFASGEPMIKESSDIPLLWRSGGWTLKRNVPQRYHGVEARRQVWRKLAAVGRSAAQREAKGYWNALIAEWERRLVYADSPEHRNLEKAREVCKGVGLNYLPAAQVALLPIDDLARRVELALGPDGKIDPRFARSFLGGVSPPKTIKDYFQAFQRLDREYSFGKTSAQLRKRQLSYWLAARRLIEAFGDVPVQQLGRTEVWRLVWDAWRNERCPQLTVGTVNARLYRLESMFQIVSNYHDLTPPFCFSQLAIRDQARRTRPAFSEDWVRDRILAQGALDGLPSDERLLLLGMINTGYRISEGANLMPSEIILEAAVPHLRFDGEFRRLKTHAAYRVIPLTGISLEAFRAAPQGFSRLRGDEALSSRLNRFLTGSGLRESDRHTTHSFRHSLSSRLAIRGVHENLIAEILGHSLRRGYGRGTPLQMLLQILKPAAF